MYVCLLILFFFPYFIRSRMKAVYIYSLCPGDEQARDRLPAVLRSALHLRTAVGIIRCVCVFIYFLLSDKMVKDEGYIYAVLG